MRLVWIEVQIWWEHVKQGYEHYLMCRSMNRISKTIIKRVLGG